VEALDSAALGLRLFGFFQKMGRHHIFFDFSLDLHYLCSQGRHLVHMTFDLLFLLVKESFLDDFLDSLAEKLLRRRALFQCGGDFVLDNLLINLRHQLLQLVLSSRIALLQIQRLVIRPVCRCRLRISRLLRDLTQLACLKHIRCIAVNFKLLHFHYRRIGLA